MMTGKLNKKNLPIIDLMEAQKQPATYWLQRSLEPDACKTCDGCGYQATDDEKSPAWNWWTLPPESQLAMTLGLVQFRYCERCLGSGIDITNTRKNLAMRPEEV